MPAMKLDERKIRIALCAVALVALFAGFHAMMFSHLPGVFRAPEEDLSHGWLVPFFALYILWRDRAGIVKSFGAPSVWGLVAVVPFACLGILGARGLQVRFELVAFVGLLVAIPWAMFGRRTAGRLLFPAAFLLFCMPLNSYLSLVTVHLRIFVSAVSAGILSFFGMDIVREGNLIMLPGVMIDGNPFGVDIADPCSGLRSIFALMALGAGYAYFSQPTWTRRAVLFLFSIPCAVAGNVCRIMSICIVAKCSSSGFATLFTHDFAGLVVFFIAIGLLFAAGEAITRICDAVCRRRSVAADPAKNGEEASVDGDRRSSVLVPVATCLLVFGAMTFQAMTPRPEIAEPPKVGLPERLDASLAAPFTVHFADGRELTLPDGVASFVGERVEPSLAETNVLVGAEVSRRRYSPLERLAWRDMPYAEVFGFDVSTVVSGPNKQSLHRPELCLPSQGADVGRSWTLDADGIEWHVIELKAKGGRNATLFAYTFFNQEGWRTSSHEARILRDVVDRTIRNRVDRWVMVTVNMRIASVPYLESVLRSLKEVVE